MIRITFWRFWLLSAEKPLRHYVNLKNYTEIDSIFTSIIKFYLASSKIILNFQTDINTIILWKIINHIYLMDKKFPFCFSPLAFIDFRLFHINVDFFPSKFSFGGSGAKLVFQIFGKLFLMPPPPKIYFFCKQIMLA